LGNTLPLKVNIYNIALLEAMKELGQRGFTNVSFEIDSKSIVDVI
jgi:ribonuclease HI